MLAIARHQPVCAANIARIKQAAYKWRLKEPASPPQPPLVPRACLTRLPYVSQAAEVSNKPRSLEPQLLYDQHSKFLQEGPISAETSHWTNERPYQRSQSVCGKG